MEQALEVFFNGIAGVFAGIGMLYLTLKLLALLADNREKDEEQ